MKRHFLDNIQSKTFFPLLPGTQENAEQICDDYAGLLVKYPADLCVLGIGENGHLAFNDPPLADFADPRRVKIVRLEDASRRQQVGEGHFNNFEEVRTHAITLTIPALLAARHVLALVPEARKVAAVHRSLMGPSTKHVRARSFAGLLMLICISTFSRQEKYFRKVLANKFERANPLPECSSHPGIKNFKWIQLSLHFL